MSLAWVKESTGLTYHWRMASMNLQDILFSQGFGTRRVCAGLIQQGHVAVAGRICQDTFEVFDTLGLVFVVQGKSWPFQERAYLMLHKPAGYECSQKPGMYPSIYTLLPGPLRMRGGGAAAGVQAVGRLDQDTTGMLLLSDDGKFIHRMSSPKHHVPKVYQVVTKHPIDDEQVRRLLDGVVLDDSPKPVKAAAAERVTDQLLHLTLTEGKYHQVKRMLAAVGNRVEGLHRARIGCLSLSTELAVGQWRWLSGEEVASLSAASQPPL